MHIWETYTTFIGDAHGVYNIQRVRAHLLMRRGVEIRQPYDAIMLQCGWTDAGGLLPVRHRGVKFWSLQPPVMSKHRDYCCRHRTPGNPKEARGTIARHSPNWP